MSTGGGSVVNNGQFSTPPKRRMQGQWSEIASFFFCAAPFSQVQVHLKSYFGILNLHILFSSDSFNLFRLGMGTYNAGVYRIACTSETRLVG